MLFLLCVFLCTLLFLYWYRRPYKFPPGPRGLPFVGKAIDIGRENLGEVFLKWREKYGPVFSVRMSNEDWVVLNNAEVIQQTLVRQGTIFSGRPPNKFLDSFSEGRGLVLVDYGPFWKTQRKFGLTTLRGFGVGKRGMEDKILEEIEFLTDEISKHEGNAFDPKPLITKAVCNVICNVAFGKRFNYEDKDFSNLLSNVTESFSGGDSNILLLLQFAFWLRHLPGFRGAFADMKKKEKDFTNFLDSFAAEHEKSFDIHDLRDFVDAFIKEMKEGTDPSFNRKQLLQYMSDLFEAGTETSSSTIIWCFLAFLNFPECQEKIYKEVDNVIGSANPTMKHQADMPYTSAFIHEVMRHRTLVPTSVMHYTSEKVEINGFVIPKNTVIIPNLWAVHHDPDTFKNPGTFRPERFISTDGKFSKSPNVIPFSVGPRHCIGQQLANMELFIFLTKIVQLFKIVPADHGKFPSFDESTPGFTFVSKPYEVKFNSRN